ncbi:MULTISPECIES: exodeoxyribonuclease VII large subunit [unclassified Psychrobacter]|uniref:exodeoxyribonuclease VII large subunit n=1 Tax=unclassified Psychrobacter TaxID=196806 RepID=UPI000C3443E6|nr:MULTISPECIES: exodeoxyribonuclease VII large subunit [unclassified Psychrobacter]MBA6245608.1 exodeoxyribonuclease VII large subunit [Psychrobacter sp. Urea-trap-18]MBA6286166.1 exodeoxyribonuclease VII large subunit [Psychrobacter sp. Urea-trap-16]MBA6318200.1 exodeoxyribonuclease VII large subunit [Psychrobacter sp. Urea-trap-20]MBA6334350.1 exodeoxyribonuclease VII large subunit [Psychrobacter sp. Urea-trap-19]PKG60533.1 exodeoxyribonuclease VII large subunit [Psychrobacter sp. Choline-3
MRKPNLSNIKQAKVLAPAKDLATLEAELAEQEDHLEDTVLRLSDYLSAVEMVIKQTFDHRVWVKAEIRNLSSKGGHYYFELAEKDDDGKVVASCRGNLWRFKAARVLAKFERATGMPLERDLTVLLKVSAGFHAQYGFSITIEDIDPSYTLGDLARQYAEMVDRLTGEGLLHLNQQLPAPFDIEHVLVIAPEKAAGLGDFQADADRLASTGACQFHYHNATFQGNHAPAEIRQAIVSAQQQFYDTYQRLPDLLVIIRGGGAVGDLAYLNDYELAALVAEQPVPVWVGIGHERDKVILDEVAHTSFDTPSKVIAAIHSHLAQLVTQTLQYQAQIKQAAQRQLNTAEQQTTRQLSQIQSQTIGQLTALRKDSDYAWRSIQQSAQRQVKQAARLTAERYTQTQTLAHQQLVKAATNSKSYQESIMQNAQQQTVQAQRDSEHLRDIVLLHRPSRVLKQGYTMLTDAQNKQTLTSSTQLYPEQTVNIILKDGNAKAQIIDVNMDKEATKNSDTLN